MVQNQGKMSCLMINDIDAGLGRFEQSQSKIKACNILLDAFSIEHDDVKPANILLESNFEIKLQPTAISKEENAMRGSSGPKLSGMQKQVLGLYRGFLRAARSKSPEDRCQIESIVSNEFRRNAKLIDHKNFLYIEYLLRRGKKQLDQLKSPETVGLSSLNVSFPQDKNS